MATATLPPGSLQRLVRPTVTHGEYGVEIELTM
jgi:hypothetical protein